MRRLAVILLMTGCGTESEVLTRMTMEDEPAATFDLREAERSYVVSISRARLYGEHLTIATLAGVTILQAWLEANDVGFVLDSEGNTFLLTNSAAVEKDVTAEAPSECAPECVHTQDGVLACAWQCEEHGGLEWPEWYNPNNTGRPGPPP